jgi:hypothetical protein
MFQPLRELQPIQYGRNDILVVFGEVFSRGYVNGLIDAAKRQGMKVIFSTVGRREKTGELRPLSADELAEKDQPLINIPLEAGFDMETPPGGRSPIEQLEGLKLSEWQTAQLDFDQVAESARLGTQRFRRAVQNYLVELEKQIPADSNVLFAHTMAGGVPRAKIVMPAMNRIFKGFGDRFASSQEFWESPMGRLCAQSFMEVTAQTFHHLIELSEPLRRRQMAAGKTVSYTAYGYHGTEILIHDKFRWQSYSPYLQGFAKLQLEKLATQAMSRGIAATCFNAPEILTNSSSIFLGVEVALYPLLGAMLKIAPTHKKTLAMVEKCQTLLKPGETVQSILQLTSDYFDSEIIAQRWSHYDQWPQHNGPEQMALMRKTSSDILARHKDERELLTAVLSEVVFRSCGEAMLAESKTPRKPVWWVGHDLVTQQFLQQH